MTTKVRSVSDDLLTTWRVGRKINLNVYEGDRPVCQCHTAKDAADIVDALNGELRQIAVDSEIVRLHELLALLPHEDGCKTNNSRVRCGFDGAECGWVLAPCTKHSPELYRCNCVKSKVGPSA